MTPRPQTARPPTPAKRLRRFACRLRAGLVGHA